MSKLSDRNRLANHVAVVTEQTAHIHLRWARHHQRPQQGLQLFYFIIHFTNMICNNYIFVKSNLNQTVLLYVMKVIIKSNKTILNCLNSTLLISGNKNRFKCNFLSHIKGVILLGNQIKKNLPKVNILCTRSCRPKLVNNNYF